nr:MAG TPA: tail sheath protein [Caudoviricetes sp.]
MISIDKLVEIGFTLPQATDISAYLSNAGYVGDFTSSDLVSGYNMPANKVVVISNIDELDSIFVPGTKYYNDLSVLLMQKNNAKPNQSRINQVVVFQKTDEDDIASAFTALMNLNANFSQLYISSSLKADIVAVAAKAEVSGRLFIAQTSDEDVASGTAGNVAETLAAKNYTNTKLITHIDSESLKGALVGVMANPYLGSVGDLYSQFSGVTPQNYDSTSMSNFDKNNVGYYSYVNAISGVGVEQYAKKIFYGNKQVNGEITKRRYIRFTIDLLLKFKVLDFLAKKLSYQESSNSILEENLKSVLIGCQSNDLIVQDSEDTNGFYLKCMPIAKVKTNYPTDYSNQVYHAQGWYIDALTGTKVIIDLTVNPSDSEKSAIEM